jgi:hypothetical protein
LLYIHHVTDNVYNGVLSDECGIDLIRWAMAVELKHYDKSYLIEIAKNKKELGKKDIFNLDIFLQKLKKLDNLNKFDKIFFNTITRRKK